MEKLKYREVESSNIKAVAHDDNTLFVQFLNGSTYKYFGVPIEKFEELVDAASCGKYLNNAIKPNYKFEKVA